MPRKQSRKQQPNVVTGIAWYKPEEWDAWRQACPEFEETYAEWEPYAQEQMRNLRGQGIAVRKVVIGVDAFLFWCLKHERSPDSGARSNYVAELLQNQRDSAER